MSNRQIVAGQDRVQDDKGLLDHYVSHLAMPDDRTEACSETAPELAEAPQDPRELDYLYKKVDALYYGVARDCGLSTSAYWMMYEIVRMGGQCSLAHLGASWAFSKQTINSALKSLVSKDLVVLSFAAGSRKSKDAALSEVGQAFSLRYIVPAIEAERRAFCSLPPATRIALVSAARSFTAALTQELSGCHGQDNLDKDEYSAGEGQ